MTGIDTQPAEARLSPVERREVEKHKYYLSEKAGCDVGMEFAIADWNRAHGPRWRSERLRRELTLQCREMERHKWLESERAGRDLGREAIRNWIDRYAREWREWWEQQNRQSG